MRTQNGGAEIQLEAQHPKLEIHPPKVYPPSAAPEATRANEHGNDQHPNNLNRSSAKTLNHLLVLLLASVLCLSACAGKSASSKFYVLSPLPKSKQIAADQTAIRVFPVAMPDYLDRPQIVTRVSENEIKLDEFSRWAGPLKENFYTVLVDNLATLLNNDMVIKTAQNPGIPVTIQLGVEVIQFDGTLGGDVVLIAKWGLFAEEGKNFLLAKRSSITEPTGASSYEALVAAQSRAVAALSREIAEAIRTRK